MIWEASHKYAERTAPLYSNASAARRPEGFSWRNGRLPARSQDLKLGDGEEFRGEGILAITKALLQSGVAYVGGYQGAPISHLMDVLADAKDVLDELGVHFETSALGGGRRGDARRLGDVSDPRRGHLQVDRSAPTSPPTRSPTSPPAASPAAR